MLEPTGDFAIHRPQSRHVDLPSTATKTLSASVAEPSARFASVIFPLRKEGATEGFEVSLRAAGDFSVRRGARLDRVCFSSEIKPFADPASKVSGLARFYYIRSENAEVGEIMASEAKLVKTSVFSVESGDAISIHVERLNPGEWRIDLGTANEIQFEVTAGWKITRADEGRIEEIVPGTKMPAPTGSYFVRMSSR